MSDGLARFRRRAELERRRQLEQIAKRYPHMAQRLGVELGRKQSRTRRKLALTPPPRIEVNGGAGLVEIAIGNRRLRLRSECNAKENWKAVHYRARGQKRLVAGVLGYITPPAAPLVVRFTLITHTPPGAGRELDQGDNYNSAFKHIRDEVSGDRDHGWLRLGDGPGDPITWEYGPQEQCGEGLQIVRIEWWPASAYRCPACARVSYHPEDRAHRYCGACHRFERDPP